MSNDPLARYQPPVALTPAQAKAELVATRERTKAQLAALEVELHAVVSWREVVRRHPVQTLVGAFAFGLALSQLFDANENRCKESPMSTTHASTNGTSTKEKDEGPVGEVAERLAPKIEEAQEQLMAINERVKGFIRENPGATLLGAAAVGFLSGQIGVAKMSTAKRTVRHHPSNDVGQVVAEAAKTATSAVNGAADAVGLTDQVKKNPYGMVAGALAVGYVAGGGLFTPTTARLIQLAAKIATIPFVQAQLLDVAEEAVDGLLNQTRKITKK